MNTYQTAELAALIGIHPNTVRLYEELGLITKPERLANGYRRFTDLQLEQFQIARLAFQIEVLQNGLRKKIVQMVKVLATGDIDGALQLTQEYLVSVRQEQLHAEEAIETVHSILADEKNESIHFLKRKEVSIFLDISTDTLRNWEMNGLLTVKRKQNGYRIYTDEDIKRLKIIRSLRCANYSLDSILRMLQQLSADPDVNIHKALDTPDIEEDIIAVCDKLITSLSNAEQNAQTIIIKLQKMEKTF